MKLLRVAIALGVAAAALFAPLHAKQPVHNAAMEPRLRQHVRRILAAQADDQAACDTAFQSNPLASFLTALPEAAGLRNCLASNINVLVEPLSAPGAKCSLTSLISLFSGTDAGMATFTEFFNALAGGLLADAETGSTPTDLASILASWTSTSTKNEGFCGVMNAQIGPCAEALLPALVSILNSKGACCSQLVELYELLKLIVPDGKTLDQTLVAIVNGLHLAMCTTTSPDSYCGQSLISYLSPVVEKTGATSLLVPLLFDAGLPLFALPAGSAACDALDSTSFSSFVSTASTTVSYADLSCCATGLASLVQSVDVVVQHLTGDSLADTMNLITGLQDAPTTKFTAPYDKLQSCSFAKQCTAPSFTLTAQPGSLPATANSPKNAQPQQLKCTKAELCDQDNVCSSVCQQGTASVAPWVARAISYQRNLSYAQPLCFTQLPATHNSGTTMARGWGNRDQLFNKVLDANNSASYMRTANQFLTVTDQLNLGARFVEIDVHYFGGQLRDGHCSRVNFALLDDVGAAIVRTAQALQGVETVAWQPSLMGCLPSLGGLRAANSRPHLDTVTELATWITTHPRDLLLVYLDVGAEVTALNQYDAMLELYTAAFGAQLFTPADLGSSSWKSFSIQSLIDKGKRAVLVASRASAATFALDELCDGWADVPGGRPGPTIWGEATNAGTVVRAYSSVLHYATMSEAALGGGADRNGSATDPASVTAETLPVFVNAGVNILAPDALDGAVVQSMVWTWAAKEPSRGDTAVEVSAKDGRWYGVVDAASVQYVACVDSVDRMKWTVAARASGCPSGSSAGAPVLAVENVALVKALRAVGSEATAQLAVDLSAFPVISAEEEAAFEAEGTDGGSPGAPPPSGGATQLSLAMAAVIVAAVLAVFEY